MSEKGYEDKVKISYLKEQGKIHVKVEPPFVVYLHPELCKLLGMSFHNTYLLDEIIGDEPCAFLPHHEYRITCNIVDKSKNLMNGKRSDIITSFVPKVKEYGDINEYTSLQTVEIQQYDFSSVEIGIKNQEDKNILFRSPYTINLLLE